MVRMQEDPGRLHPIPFPKIVSRETEKVRVITMSLAGVTKDRISIEAKKGYLTIEVRQAKANSTTNFVQIINLPQGIKTSAITAEYNKGLLTITMPKDKKAKKPQAATIVIPVK
jgi:HSP20 family molecular chaperone IbpA